MTLTPLKKSRKSTEEFSNNLLAFFIDVQDLIYYTLTQILQ